LLDAGQRKALGEVIWKNPSESGIPQNTGLYQFAILAAPHPNGCKPRKLFKAFVKKSLGSLSSSLSGPGTALPFTGGDIPVAWEIIGANRHSQGIWTSVDAKEILGRLSEWWEAESRQLAAKDEWIKNEFRLRLENVPRLLAAVVGPRLKAGVSQEVKTSLGQVLNRVREAGMPVAAAKAACLHIFPERAGDILRQIGESLARTRDETVEDALWALEKIIFNAPDYPRGSAKADPVSMLIEYLDWGPARFVSGGITISARILKNTPRRYSAGLKSATLGCLGRLFEEASYNAGSGGLAFEEKLAVRRIAAECAGAIWKACISKRATVPEVITKWKDACASDYEFSEVRSAWADGAAG
jgi:hypothetical protein